MDGRVEGRKHTETLGDTPVRNSQDGFKELSLIYTSRESYNGFLCFIAAQLDENQL